MSLAIAALGAVLAGFAALLEVRRGERRNRAARVIAAALAAASLALLLDPPRTSAARRTQVALLVTPLADPALVTRVRDSVRPGVVLDADSLPDLRTLRARRPDIRELVIVGSGVEPGALEPLAGIALSFVPSLPENGIHALAWPADAALGEEIVISGRAARGARVHLDDGGSADSTVADSTGRFTLRATPRAAGLARLALRSGDRVADTVAVFVRDAAPPAVLVLRSGPSFEASRLRDWLARRGGSVLVHAEVSAGRTRSERVNTAAGPVRPLTAATLDSFDVLWPDARVLRRLDPSERDALRAAVASGLGLLVEPGALGAARAVLGEPFPQLTPGAEARMARLRWADGGALPPSPLAAGTLSALPPSGSLATDERGRAAILWVPLGAGRALATLVTRPSRWLLEGERPAWDAYWSRVLGALRRPRARWELEGFPFAPHRMLTIRRAGQPPIAAVIAAPSGATDTVSLDPDGRGGVAGRFWPRESGPHTVTGGGDSLIFEVSAAESWRPLRAAQRRDATNRWIAAHAVARGAERAAPTPTPVSRLWFFFALLCATTYLWWERRAA